MQNLKHNARLKKELKSTGMNSKMREKKYLVSTIIDAASSKSLD